MKTDILRLSGDASNIDEIVEGLRNRVISQKFIYLGKGTENYYNYDNSFWNNSDIEIIDNSDIEKVLNSGDIDFFKDKLVFISIACGNSKKEVELLKSYDNPNIRYIGIDFSEEMLQLSKENLKNVNFESFLIRADISDLNLKKEINLLSKGFDNRFFTFLGNTFGNIKPTNIVDLLSSYMNKGDKLLLDVTIKENNIKSSLEVFRHYKEKTRDNFLWRNYILSAFSYIDFPIENGKILIETEEDSKVGFYKIKFLLDFIKDTEFELENKVIILEGEKVTFYELYYYIPNKLINFMESHYFKLLNKELKDIDGQFLFEKE